MGARAEPQDEEVGEDVARASVPARDLIRFVAKLVIRHPWLLATSLAASVGMALTGIVSISLLVPFIQELSGSSFALPAKLQFAFIQRILDPLDTASTIRAIAMLLVAVQLFRSALAYLESRVSTYLKILIERDLRERVFDELLHVEYVYIQRERLGHLQAVLHGFPKQAADVVDQYLAATSRVFSASTYLIYLLTISVPLTILAGLLAIVSIFAVQGLNAAVKRNARVTNELRVRLQQTSLESLAGMRIIRLFAREKEARERYSRDLRAMRRQSFRGGSIAAAIPPIQTLINIALVAALIVAATYVLPSQSQGAWLPTLALFLLVTIQLVAPVQAFSKRRAKITGEIPALEEVYRFLMHPKPRLREGTARFDRLREDVRFEGVTFQYPGTNEPALRDVSVTIPRGKTTAFVGQSGSGKSTLLALLARSSDPTAGAVLIDGRDLREYDSATWRRRIAFVSQDNFLFHDTVRNNIRFARPDASQAEIEEAARQAQAHDFILALEDGYETVLGERGARLSGGQAQRIAIARALLADPDILVLDEATSALDVGTERVVQAALDAASEGRTVIVVAHRLATIRNADIIHVLEAGRIVQSGTHAELNASVGAYRSFVQLQDMDAAPTPRATSAPHGNASPLRVVLSEATGEARIANGSSIGTLDLVACASEAAALDRANGAPDVVALHPGAQGAIVRLRGLVYRDVPLYVEVGGAERRVRVRSAQGEGRPRVRLAD